MKNIWIWNHYATKMCENQGGRHYWFAENLIKNGYKATIFCASTHHDNGEQFIEIQNKYTINTVNNITFVFIRTPSYKGNGVRRILNMLAFYKNLYTVARNFASEHGKPDIILASSAHPLTLVAGIKIAKKFGIPCICEVRDLWPESLVAYGCLKKNSILAKLLYAGEKWIYKRADAVIFTMEGGRDYIIEKRWDKQHGGAISLDKVYHINNGIDLEAFDNNSLNHVLKDTDLNDPSTYKIVYCGSLRRANRQIFSLIDAVALMQGEEYRDIRFFIYGDGDERNNFENICRDNGYLNVLVKGRIEKKYVPYVLSKCDLNVLNCATSDIVNRYGGSQNKLFDYLASGKPILSGESSRYSIVNNYNCGISKHMGAPCDLVNAIAQIRETCYSAEHIRSIAARYSFSTLTAKLIEIIERTGNDQ